MEYKDLKKLCDNHEIKYDESQGSVNLLEIQIPKEREFTSIFVRKHSCKEIFSKFNEFFKYRFVKNYDAIWSEEKDYLECEVNTNLYFNVIHSHLYRKLEDEFIEITEDRKEIIKIPSPIEGAEIELSIASSDFLHFSYLKDRHPRMPRDFITKRKISTLKIKNAGIKNHTKATSIITKLFASICFQLNITTNTPIQLSQEKTMRKRLHNSQIESIPLEQARYEYNLEPLSMFWHAENLIAMPLQQYFSYYQAIEYYFTIYSYADAQNKIRNLVKKPLFNIDDNKDLSKILNIVKYSSSSNSFGNELSQLKSTIEICLNIDELNEWFNEDQEREDYFVSKQARKISGVVIKQTGSHDDLISSIAKRIYAIRCRIVHTKGTDDNVEILHPLSNEARNIKFDIELIQMVCTQVIIANGKTLTI